MYIEKVELENFRGFAGKHEIVLHPELTVFAGVNGSGKSAVLDVVGTMLAGIVGFIEKKEFSWVYPGSPDEVHNGASSGRVSVGFRSGGGTSGTLNRVLLSDYPGFSITTQEIHFLDEYRPQTNQTTLPFLGQITATSRRPALSESNGVPPSGRFLAYRGAFASDGIPFTEAEAWFEREENLENQKKIAQGSFTVEQPSLKAVRGAMQRGLTVLQGCTLGKPGVERKHWTDPLTPATGRLFLTKGAQQLFVDQLSDGERRIAIVLLDTARRMVMLNPHLEDPTLVPGILAVDEVDLHLHPQWQRSVVACLRAAFPKLQLLLSTHSPIVLSSVPNECVVMMGPKGVIGRKVQMYGRDPNTILTTEMDTPQRPAEVQEKLDQLFVWVDTNQKNAKKLLKELEGTLGPDDPDLVQARALLDLLEV